MVRLIDAAELPVTLVGGKASTLARLTVAGFPVPPGLVIASAAWDRPQGELGDAVRAALDAADFSGAGGYAVRSSAAAEDLPGASYAGQYETFLDVAKEDVVDAIHRCRAAAESARVAAYQAGRGGWRWRCRRAEDGGAGAGHGAGPGGRCRVHREPPDR